MNPRVYHSGVFVLIQKKCGKIAVRHLRVKNDGRKVIMKTIAFDTSNQPLSVALFEDDKLIGQRETNVAKNHSVQLLPFIDELVHEAGWQPSDLDRVIVSRVIYRLTDCSDDSENVGLYIADCVARGFELGSLGNECGAV